METIQGFRNYTQLLTRLHEVNRQKGGDMEEVVKELREIKELLRIIASNTEQIKQESTQETENQSFYGASTNHPYVVQLPVADLVALYAARAERYTHSPAHKKQEDLD